MSQYRDMDRNNNGVEMKCSSCERYFLDIFHQTYACHKCLRIFCQECVQCNEYEYQCRLCNFMSNLGEVPLTYAALLELTKCDLQCFLQNQGIVFDSSMVSFTIIHSYILTLKNLILIKFILLFQLECELIDIMVSKLSEFLDFKSKNLVEKTNTIQYELSVRAETSGTKKQNDNSVSISMVSVTNNPGSSSNRVNIESTNHVQVKNLINQFNKMNLFKSHASSKRVQPPLSMFGVFSESRKLSSTIAQQESENDKNLCKVCLVAEMDCVFLRCGHVCCCNKCGSQIMKNKSKCKFL